MNEEIRKNPKYSDKDHPKACIIYLYVYVTKPESEEKSENLINRSRMIFPRSKVDEHNKRLGSH